MKYGYDAANRLGVVRQDNGTAVQGFQYGSDNQRLFSYDYSAAQLTIHAGQLAQYVEFTHTVPTWTKSYYFLGSSAISTATRNGSGGESIEFNHPDQLGTRTITNQSAGTNYEQASLPFGTALSAESTTSLDKRFTSYERSSQTGLDYAINRTYNSKQGRFTQIDPIGMSAVSLAAPQTLNLYTYCGNDPINHTDPSGLFFGSFFKWLGKKLWGFVKRVIYAAVKAAVTAAIAFITSGFSVEVFIGVFIGSFVQNLAFPKIGNILTPGWNPNASHPLGGSSGLSSKYVIRNFTSNYPEISLNVFSTVGAIFSFLAINPNQDKEGIDYCKVGEKKRYFKNPADLSDDIKKALRTAMEKEGLDWSVFRKDGPKNFRSLGFIIIMESEGEVGAKNTSGSSARGLMQLTKVNYKLNPNGEKSFGNAVEEIQGGIRYIKQRYGTPQKAREFWKKNCYY